MSFAPLVLCVGLIGAGKSTVLNVFKGHGAALISADLLWKETVYQEGNRDRLKRVFGEDVLLGDGTPDLGSIRSHLFSVSVHGNAYCLSIREKLYEEFEKIFMHSLAMEIEKKRASDAHMPMVVVENATALIHGWDTKIDPVSVISLICPQDVRMKRVLKRNAAVREETYLEIMSVQPSDQEHLTMSQSVNAHLLNTNCSIETALSRSTSLCLHLLTEFSSRQH